MVSIWCVGFASLYVVCDELDCAWKVCLSDLCVYVYCVESSAHIDNSLYSFLNVINLHQMIIALPYLFWDVQQLVAFQLSWALHISDTNDALEAVRPSMFADVTVNAVKTFCLFTADIILLELFDVLEE